MNRIIGKGHRSVRAKVGFICMTLAIMGPAITVAGERHFTYVYETSVLPNDGRELEVSNTFRIGKSNWFSGFDQRIEMEFGLGHQLQTSLYLNYKQELAADSSGNVEKEVMFDGISNEWKWKLSDPVADIIGLGLYAELGLKPDELELETKILLDKRFQNWLWNLNFTVEQSYEYDPVTGFTPNYTFDPTMGLGFFITHSFMIGCETRWFNTYKRTEVGTHTSLANSIFSVGPVVSYTSPNWFATATFLPQVANVKGNGQDYDPGEGNAVKWEGRLIFSFAL